MDRELALVRSEIEAKIAEQAWPGAPGGVNPHHLTNAIRRLEREQVIKAEARQTKGTRHIPVYVPVNQAGRATATDRAARRKRLLYTRYLGWSQASTEAPNLIGVGGERVALASLRAANVQTPIYTIVNPEGGDVTRLLGAAIDGGSLDAAARLIVEGIDHDDVVTVPIEVKNLRGWIYPSTQELYQLLDKAARLQVAHPTRLFLPVFICRKVHYLTYLMAKHLGFIVTQFDRSLRPAQPIAPHHTLQPERMQEVREELGFVFAHTDGPMPTLVRRFGVVIPQQALEVAGHWRAMAPTLAPRFRRLRSIDLDGRERDEGLDDLYTTACAITAPEKPWRSVEPEVDDDDSVPW